MSARGSRSHSSCRQTERGGKNVRDAEQSNGHSASRWRLRIASQSRLPREPRVRPRSSGKRQRRSISIGSDVRFLLYRHPLVTQELDTGVSMKSAAPISPEERLIANHKRMQEHTDLARLFGGAALPLTLLTQRTGATTANAGRIHDTQTPIGLAAALLSRTRLPCWTPERPVGLERKVGSGETPRFPRSGSGRWTVPRGRGR